MSYSIYIGEALVEALDPEDDSNQLQLVVRSLELPEAPTFPNDAMTGNSNGRHPGYSQWSEFLRMVGLYDLFFHAEEGLMRDHPGTFLLRPKDLERIREALGKWRAEHPQAVPGFLDGQDFILPRLIWLEFWVAWALDNCLNPAIHNY